MPELETTGNIRNTDPILIAMFDIFFLADFSLFNLLHSVFLFHGYCLVPLNGAPMASVSSLPHPCLCPSLGLGVHTKGTTPTLAADVLTGPTLGLGLQGQGFRGRGCVK